MFIFFITFIESQFPHDPPPSDVQCSDNKILFNSIQIDISCKVMCHDPITKTAKPKHNPLETNIQPNSIPFIIKNKKRFQFYWL